MSRSLNFVEPLTEAHMNILLYGPPKTGKTVGAATAPGPILYLNADRPNATRYAHSRRDDLKEVHVQDLDTLLAAAEEVQTNPDNWGTVVLDPVGETYRAIIDGLSGKAMRPKIQEYGDTGTHLERFCRFMCDAPVHFVIVAHETATKDEEAGTFERLPWTGTNNPALGAKLMAMVDVIGYTGVVTEDDGPTRYMAQTVSGGGRRGGDRFGVLGTGREVNITEWAELAREATAPKKGSNQEKEKQQNGD